MAGRPPNSRRRFLRAAAAITASGALPALSWADAGAPAYLAAGRKASGDFALAGLSAGGDVRFELPLPGRGHAAAAHPRRPLAVAFARRPGVFAAVIDCALGVEVARFEAPAGRHFYGHGAFDPAGRLLYTCENAFDSGAGVVGVWDASDGFRRLGEFASGGVGPHELLYDRGAGRLVVANGGVRTHPDSGRAKLNIPDMRPNLAYLDPASGEVLQIVEPPQALRLNSIRHLALRSDGLAAAALQWQGDLREAPPLLATHRFGEPALRLLTAERREQLRLRGYGGSVAFSGDGGHVAITSPRGGRLHLFEAESGALRSVCAIADVCGVAPLGDGLLATDGGGGVSRIEAGGAPSPLVRAAMAWDNHLIAL